MRTGVLERHVKVHMCMRARGCKADDKRGGVVSHFSVGEGLVI